MCRLTVIQFSQSQKNRMSFVETSGLNCCRSWEKADGFAVTLHWVLTTHNLPISQSPNCMLRWQTSSGNVWSCDNLLNSEGADPDEKTSELHLLRLHCTPLTDKSELHSSQPVETKTRKNTVTLKRQTRSDSRSSKKLKKTVLPFQPTSYWSPTHRHLPQSWEKREKTAPQVGNRLNILTSISKEPFSLGGGGRAEIQMKV